ncbi:MAG: hypothetical protein E3J28_00725 [Desulfobacteraceae bacterium]|nr:MAG: hypothetical protein E3J28_00725 [Desulfobacteraceae bacterium]
MIHLYDNYHYNPPAPVLPIIIRIPDSIKQLTTDALVDTGADITCLPRAFIATLRAERASTYDVFAINGVSVGPSDSYFLEFELAGMKELVEVIAIGDEPILGRNLINEFTIQLYGPKQKLEIKSHTK